MSGSRIVTEALSRFPIDDKISIYVSGRSRPFNGKVVELNVHGGFITLETSVRGSEYLSIISLSSITGVVVIPGEK